MTDTSAIRALTDHAKAPVIDGGLALSWADCTPTFGDPQGDGPVAMLSLVGGRGDADGAWVYERVTLQWLLKHTSRATVIVRAEEVAAAYRNLVSRVTGTHGVTAGTWTAQFVAAVHCRGVIGRDGVTGTGRWTAVVEVDLLQLTDI